jgi:uncharacterized protein
VSGTTDPPTAALAPFRRRRTAILTSYRLDGRPVDTPLTLAVDDGRAFIRTYDKAWKAKRMRRNPHVLITPSTVRGKPRGPTLAAHSRLLSGEEATHAARALTQRQPILQGLLVPLTHRLMRYRTLHYELTPVDV